jgi:hypothetical protein
VIDKLKIDKLLSRIESSNYLNTELDFNLLKYLTNASLSGKILKEHEIAADIFGRVENFNPMEDSIVRSHMHSLRKKMKEYNLTEGANDLYQIIIPKGQYKVEFLETTTQSFKQSRANPIFQTLTGIIIILISLLLYLTLKNDHVPTNTF